MLWTRQLRPPEICTLRHQPDRIPSSAFVCGAIILVALDKQFVRHHGTKPRSCGRWRNESWQTGKSPGHRTAEILPARSHRDTSSSSNTSCANEIIYCGCRFDSESQLYYVRNRTYNAALGRWIQRDPIGYEGGINLYGYVGGRPDARRDASGLASSLQIPPGWIPIKCPPRALEHCVNQCKGDGYAGNCPSKTKCYFDPDAGYDLFTPEQAICACKLKPCDFYRLWCEWGVYHGHSVGGWVRTTRECDQCYQRCVGQTVHYWSFRCCPIGKKGGTQMNWNVEDQGCVLPDEDIS